MTPCHLLALSISLLACTTVHGQTTAVRVIQPESRDFHRGDLDNLIQRVDRDFRRAVEIHLHLVLPGIQADNIPDEVGEGTGQYVQIRGQRGRQEGQGHAHL